MVPASETDNNYFTIERSANGIEFHRIKNISREGTSLTLHRYEWSDKYPLRETSYYRLKQTIMDSHNSLAEVKSVRYNAGENNITIYPLPNKGNTINITGFPDYNNHHLTLMNGSGAAISTSPLSYFSVTLPELQAGIYIICLENKLLGQNTNLKYIKL